MINIIILLLFDFNYYYLLREYPNRVPIICEAAPRSVLPPLKKTKYLVPYDMTINQFQFLIRRNLDLTQESALYLITSKGIALIGEKTMMEVYNNFLYIYYDCEITMG